MNIGTGIRTVDAQTAGDLLGIEVEAVEVRVGDSTLPAVPLSAKLPIRVDHVLTSTG